MIQVVVLCLTILVPDYFPFTFTHMSRLMTKPTKWHVRPAKTQIGMDIRPV